jgi:hypothetical protein
MRLLIPGAQGRWRAIAHGSDVPQIFLIKGSAVAGLGDAAEALPRRRHAEADRPCSAT